MLILPLLFQAPAQLTLDLGKPGVAVSPMLYGQMTEEINYSYDGGLYGELVRNRAFRNDPQRPASWSAVGEGASIALENRNGATPSLPVSLRVKGGVANEGYWGFPIRPSTRYRLSLWAKADADGPISASLESKDGTTTFAKAELTGVGREWRKLNAVLTTSAGVSPTKDARLVLRTGDRTVWLSLVSLFPPTYKERSNGLRPELMRMLVDMKPKFLRFPGGNYLEGNTFKDRFPWKETLGPLEERPGHQTPWGYRSTNGMGMMEFLLWCEDMGAKPVLGVFAGYTLNKDYVKEGTELEGFVKDALDQIEYVVGDAKRTKWGARRAKDGHPAPFPLEYVEVGNEDGFDDSGSYEGRFVQFYDAIKKRYPKIKVISSTGGKDYLGAKFPITRRRPDLWDEHYYSEAWDMMGMATKYDDYDRKGPKVFVGEWAAHDTVAPWQAGPQAGPTPNLKCTLADAAFMTGLERNSDVVEMACYAPLLVNVNPGGRQWSLNLIGYDALNVFGSPSYYAQKMFAQNLGDRTVPLTFTGVPTQSKGERTLPGLFASATRDTKTGALHLKLVNALPTPQEVAFDIRGGRIAPDGSMTVLRGDDLKAMNSIEEPTKIAPVTTPVGGLSNTFRRTLPGYSVVVLVLQGTK
ncbi:MAG: alpha-L-arabinofuranosidase C-terminal domain-containing protein [Fimbriimonas sp.]